MNRTGILSDASSVIYLAKADALAEAHALVGELLVPPAVWQEVNTVEGREQRDQARIRSAHEAGSLQLVELDSAVARRAFQIGKRRRIGPGESQVLTVALRGDLILMDDRRAARVGKSMGLIPMRTISLPVVGFRRGLIAPPEALGLLRRLARVIGERADVLMRLETDILEGRR